MADEPKVPLEWQLVFLVDREGDLHVLGTRQGYKGLVLHSPGAGWFVPTAAELAERTAPLAALRSRHPGLVAWGEPLPREALAALPCGR